MVIESCAKFSQICSNCQNVHNEHVLRDGGLEMNLDWFWMGWSPVGGV